MSSVKKWTGRIIESVGKVILGKQEVIEKLLVALLCRGHVLLEDVPGVGKTILARAISTSLGGRFNRIQCTPDLLPADVLGVSVYNPKTEKFDFKNGPIITNILLVDEINRATPRTQSALLEAMEEGSISVEGRSIDLPDPFFIIATENPVEFEGTFPLPEAQKDRFFLSLSVGYPPAEAEKDIILAQRRMTHPVTDLEAVSTIDAVIEMQEEILQVNIEERLEDYILQIVNETRHDGRLQTGASPRASVALKKGSQALAAIRGKSSVSVEDIREITVPVLQKRITVKSEFLLKNINEVTIIEEILERTKVPAVGAGV